MRFALAVIACAIAAGPVVAGGVPREMVELVPAFIAARVSPDMAGPGDVKPAPFAACLHARGVTAKGMRAAIGGGAMDRRMTACLDRFVGL